MNKIKQQISAASCGGVTKNDTEGFEGRYLFPDHFCGFDGHFPDNPILPAMVEIMTVVSLVGEYTGCNQRLVSVEDAKFLAPVRPNQELLVRCCQRTVKGKLLYDAKLTVAGTISATVLIELVCVKELP